MVQFHVLTWDARDEDHQHIIRMFGKTIEGKSVCVTTPFKPYFFLKVPANMNAADTIKHVTDICPDIVRCDVVTGRDMEGFQNDEKRSFIQVTCNNLLSRRFISNKLRKTNKEKYKSMSSRASFKMMDLLDYIKKH